MTRRLFLSGLVAFVLGGCDDTVAAPDATSLAGDASGTAAVAGSMELVEEPEKPLALIFLDGHRVDTDGHRDNGSVLRSLFPPTRPRRSYRGSRSSWEAPPGSGGASRPAKVPS